MTEALILVGGLGTRLRPLTVSVAKPMLPVAGVPFLVHVVARLAAAGVQHVVLATSYQAETFTAGLGDGARFGVSIDYVEEEAALGTGGAIRNAAALLDGGPDEPVAVLNGDVLSGHDLAAQVAAWRASTADVSLHLVEVADARPFGCVPTDEAGRVTGFLEKSPEPVTNRINAGCYVFRRSVIDRIPAGRVVSVERETFPDLLASGARVLAYVENPPPYWLDLGTPAAYVRGSADLVRGLVASPALPGPPGEWLALEGAEIAADARLGGGTVVGARATVATGAVLEAAVVHDGARIGEDAVVRRCVIGSGAVIGQGAVLEDSVVGEGAEVGAGNELRAGARVWSGARLPPYTIRFSADGG